MLKFQQISAYMLIQNSRIVKLEKVEKYQTLVLGPNPGCL